MRNAASQPASAQASSDPAEQERARFSPAFAIGCAAALVLGWLAAADVGFRDAGELGAAAYTLGVAHPTGFAFDLLALRLFAFLPLGHIAWRENLLVALEAAAALGVLAALCSRLARQIGAQSGVACFAGGALAACGLASWPTFFETAISVEVYSLALLAALFAGYGVARGGRSVGLAWLVLGFSPGLHVTAALTALCLVCAVLLIHGRERPGRLIAVRVPVVIAGALVALYLPLAALRRPPLVWGDPTTPGKLLAHLTAARIRSAYHGAMLAGSDGGAAVLSLQQLAALWPLLPLALVGLWFGLRRRPLCALGPLFFLACDWAYALWVNPMGIADRQVGHATAAGLALLAGIGATLAIDACPRRLQLPAASLAGVVALALAAHTPRVELDPSYAASELLGSGGRLAQAPPRALLLCSGDDICAGALFALYAECVRPDMDVAPAQHLWDEAVLRRLRWLRPGALRGAPPPSRRRALAHAVLSELLQPSSPRPVLLESVWPLRAEGLRVPLVADAATGYLRPLAQADSTHIDPEALRALERARDARIPKHAAIAERARDAWSIAFGSLGEIALGTSLAVAALRDAVDASPTRATAWVNLAAALEARGDLQNAIASARRAIELAPGRATAWVDLARFELSADSPAAARQVIELARRAGIRDPRLFELERALAVKSAAHR